MKKIGCKHHLGFVDEPVLQFFKLELMWDTQNAQIADKKVGHNYFQKYVAFQGLIKSNLITNNN